MHPIVSYSRDLIRLALLPPDLHAAVLDWIVKIVEQAIKRGDLPAPPAQRRRSSGRNPIYVMPTTQTPKKSRQAGQVDLDKTAEVAGPAEEPDTMPFMPEEPSEATGEPGETWSPSAHYRFRRVAHLKAFGHGTAKIVALPEEEFGRIWPGQHETYSTLPHEEQQKRLRKLHKETVRRDVRKARRERARTTHQA